MQHLTESQARVDRCRTHWKNSLEVEAPALGKYDNEEDEYMVVPVSGYSKLYSRKLAHYELRIHASSTRIKTATL